MQVSWTAEAVRDLNSARAYIARDNPTAAHHLAGRVRDAGQMLEGFPMLGRAGDFEDTRELPIAGTPYLLVYRVTPDTVQILRLIHGAQLWPPETWTAR